MASNGFCKVDDLKVNTRAGNSFHEEVLQPVKRDSKRSNMADEGTQQLAHTIDPQALLMPITSPEEVPLCVHGTYKYALESIMREGLPAVRRNHVHFSTSLWSGPGVGASGLRPDHQVLIFLDVRKALEAKMRLYLSENKVVVTRGFDGIVPPRFFAKVVEVNFSRPFLPEQAPRHRGKATLVLDVNGTLLSQVPTTDVKPENALTAVALGKSLVFKRPHADAFLRQMAELYEVVAFTSRAKQFAEVLLNILDPERKVFTHRLYICSCEPRGVKNLFKLGRPMERVMIVDDSYKKCVHNKENWIPIPTFKRRSDDRELLDLIPFFVEVAELEDVRPAIKTKFGDVVAEEHSKRQRR